MKTIKRIEIISNVVELVSKNFDKKVVIADIGTDHGYVAEKLSKLNFVDKVIATDISEKSLSKLENLIKKDNLKNIETVCGDGLEPIEKVDICVVAGMGGAEIIKMIKTQNSSKNDENKCNFFVFQPTQNFRELREYLFDNKIYIIKDFVFEDENRFYHIVAASFLTKENNKKSVFNLYVGRDSDLKNDDVKNYLSSTKNLLSFIENVDYKRIKLDKILYEKYKLYKLIDKLQKQA